MTDQNEQAAINRVIEPANRAETNSPFKFLDAYEKKDKSIFFGREQDIESLYDATYRTDLMLVYGQSGTGKTSLIQCGLANRFRDTDWFDVYVRRGTDINRSLDEAIREEAETPIADGVSVSEAIESLYLDFLKPIYLIFDQFEDLFVLGSKKEQQSFFETVANLIQLKISCKIILVMREEYIGRLDDFEKVVPGLLNSRKRVETMHAPNVETVIKRSAAAFDIQIDEPDETIKQIIENNKDKKGTIQLPFLQVYLDRLYKEAAAGNTEIIRFTLDLVEERIGKIGDVISDFLNEQTSRIQETVTAKYPHTPEDIARQVLNQFITVEGTNLPLPLNTLLSKFSELKSHEDILTECLSGFEDARILRLSGKNKTYEIAHDALAQQIHAHRSIEEEALLNMERLVKSRFAAYDDTKALLTKRELNYIESQEEKLKSKLASDEINFIVKSRKKASNRRTIFALGAAAIFIILLLAFFASLKWREAEKNYKRAEANRLAFAANIKADDDPTIAFLVAEEAWKLDKNTAVTETIRKIYRENVFYKTLAKLKMPIIAIAFSPDGKTILTGSCDGIARLWNRQGKEIMGFKGHTSDVSSVAFSPDGKTILTGSSDNTARLWNHQGKEILVLSGHTGYVTSVTFSPDGKTILTGSADGTARLWDLKGKERQVFNGHTGYVTSVAFSLDGKTILTGSRDTTARLWDPFMPLEELLKKGDLDPLSDDQKKEFGIN